MREYLFVCMFITMIILSCPVDWYSFLVANKRLNDLLLCSPSYISGIHYLVRFLRM